ncbi:unnamed protein product [Brassica napus]|uniref:(rape) hypothetical protein n=1 Tax=Brassica napus TaxID=3708 RepID=A0A816PF04_BRANA|nr:unnamed protein product [Brassica napus]
MDIISGLSDDLLIKILLLVPTKVAVSTSILSKRWEYLWMWLPKLQYGHRREPEREKLRCFLDRNLPLHRAPVIESFRLELCNTRFKPESINMWVVVALSHCLRELEIVYETYPPKPNILPSNMYTSKSLVILKLDGEILLDVPRMVSLPSLKTLKLQSVRYVNDETLQRLLSNCPILEDLVVRLREYGDTMQKLTVVAPSVRRSDAQPSFILIFVFDIRVMILVKIWITGRNQALWSAYTGEPEERAIVGYILKHAVHLKTATIKSYGSDVWNLEILKELELSPRASKTCQLMFE